jgi:NADP-dependent 3-hydroxy acid dehydrogenase YdfG
MKIAITGHTKGIGKCIKDLLEKDGHEVVGASTSTGINVMRTKSVINWLTKENPDVQCHILYQLYEKWQYEDKLIINLSSTSGESHTHFQQLGFNKDWTPYVSDKARLNFASLYLSERFNEHHKCRVTNISPGFVRTQAVAMFKPFIDEYCFMEPSEVAEMVQWVVNGPKHMQIKVLSFNTGNSTIAPRRDRKYETKATEVGDKLYGQDFSQTWDGKEK